jgi:hypothetical protein
MDLMADCEWGRQVGNGLPPGGGPGKESRGDPGRALSSRITSIMDQLTPRPFPRFQDKRWKCHGWRR